MGSRILSPTPYKNTHSRFCADFYARGYEKSRCSPGKSLLGLYLFKSVSRLCFWSVLPRSVQTVQSGLDSTSRFSYSSQENTPHTPLPAVNAEAPEIPLRHSRKPHPAHYTRRRSGFPSGSMYSARKVQSSVSIFCLTCQHFSACIST